MKKQPQNSRQKPKPAVKKVSNVRSTVKPVEVKVIGPPIFDKFETFAAKNEKWLMWGTFILSLICSISLFDMKVSIGGDDSAYVERAYNFISKGKYPYYQGPGYLLVLSLLMKVFGF